MPVDVGVGAGLLTLGVVRGSLRDLLILIRPVQDHSKLTELSAQTRLSPPQLLSQPGHWDPLLEAVVVPSQPSGELMIKTGFNSLDPVSPSQC